MARGDWSDYLQTLYDRFLGLKGMPDNAQTRKITIGLCRDIEKEARRCGDKNFAKRMKELRKRLKNEA